MNMKGEKCPFVTQLRYATSFLVSEIIDSQLSSWICLKKSCGKFKMSSLFLLGEMGSPYTSIDFESKMSKKNQFFIQKWSWNGLGVFPQVMGVLLVEFLDFRFLNRNFMTYMICFLVFFFKFFEMIFSYAEFLRLCFQNISWMENDVIENRERRREWATKQSLLFTTVYFLVP